MKQMKVDTPKRKPVPWYDDPRVNQPVPGHNPPLVPNPTPQVGRGLNRRQELQLMRRDPSYIPSWGR